MEKERRCDICIDETCKGKRDCNCGSCARRSECPRVLRPTVRITNRCTQKCGHCCFKSSPESRVMMTVGQSGKTARFLKANGVKMCQVMGGEFFCNPDWEEIVSNIAGAVLHTRLVTNGDWAGNPDVEAGLLRLLGRFGDALRVSVSRDGWHTNRKVDAALEFLGANGFVHNVTAEGEMTESSVVPVGRGWDSPGSVYMMFQTYCSNPDSMYGFLIDEAGDIYKCAFGNIVYASVDDYLEGGFAARFKEFGMMFNSHFIPSCFRCYEAGMIHKACVQAKEL